MSKIAVVIAWVQTPRGCVDSSGWEIPYVLPASTAADAAGRGGLFLFHLAREEGRRVAEDELADVVEYKNSISAGVQGTIEVPEGMTVVQCSQIDLSTDDEMRRSAKVLNNQSLAEHYRQLARKYTALAEKAGKE